MTLAESAELMWQLMTPLERAQHALRTDKGGYGYLPIVAVVHHPGGSTVITADGSRWDEMDYMATITTFHEAQWNACRGGSRMYPTRWFWEGLAEAKATR